MGIEWSILTALTGPRQARRHCGELLPWLSLRFRRSPLGMSVYALREDDGECQSSVVSEKVAEDLNERGGDRERSEQTGRKVRANRVKGRTFVGGRPYLSGLRRAGKTFAAAAANVFSGRREYSQRALRTNFHTIGQAKHVASPTTAPNRDENKPVSTAQYEKKQKIWKL